MNIPQSEGHEIFSEHVNKISISPIDSKRRIADDGIHTNAFRNTPTLTDAEIAEVEEYLELLLGR